MTTQDVAASLGAKLDALDLSEDERTLLHAVVAAADGGEVAGFRSAKLGDLLPKLSILDDDIGLLRTGYSVSGHGGDNHLK